MIIPEMNEYFMRLDLVTHQLKIKFRNEVILSPFSSSGLFPEWEFNLNFQLENLDDDLELTIIRKKGEEKTIYEILKTLIPIRSLFPQSKDAINKILNTQSDEILQY